MALLYLYLRAVHHLPIIFPLLVYMSHSLAFAVVSKVTISLKASDTMLDKKMPANVLNSKLSMAIPSTIGVIG